MSDYREVVLRREPGPMARSFAALILRLALGVPLLLHGYAKYQDMAPPSPTAIAQADSSASGDEAVAPLTNPQPEPEAATPKAKYPDGLVGMFANNRFKNSILSPSLVTLFAQLLPYAEMGLGLLLILGLFTYFVSLLSGLLLILLLFGQVVLSLDDPAMIEKYRGMYLYILVNVGVVWLAPITSNYLSLDGLLFGWFWKPKVEGEFSES